MLPGFGAVNVDPPEEFYNLPLVLAYGALEDVLAQLLDERVFPWPKKRDGSHIKRPTLDNMMTASHTHGAPQWVNYTKVNAGRVARNGVAHKGVLLTKPDCLAFIDTVEVELKAWSIL
jgi:hypothetical protein